MYSLLQRLRSLRHRVGYGVSERLRWSRGAFRETPAGELPVLPPQQAERIAALQSRYQVRFEALLSPSSSVNNYEYLDILDCAWCHSGMTPPPVDVLCDVGCASFWYAATLNSFFRPKRLVGVELEGHRLFRDGRARIDYARGYVAGVPNAQFVVADYLSYGEAADLITAWFPFLTPAAILAWRLPLSLLRPRLLFERIQHNLKAGGLFVMVNHGLQEAAIATQLCDAAGLELRWRWAELSMLSKHRLEPPVVSLWRRQEPYRGRP
jgi:hypothetical protein